MSQYTDQDRAIALIGIYQVAQQVYELATKGKTNELAYHTSINSLFIENPDNTLAVYGGAPVNIQMGVNTLLSQMGNGDQDAVRNLEVTKYVLNLMILEKKLSQMGEPLDKVFRILESAKDNRKVFGDFHENIIATVARAYKENVSSVNPRIMVNGAHGHLQNPTIANKIRALLLAGIRASLLWRQVGGTRWGLLWHRKKYLRAAQALLRTELDASSAQKSPYFGSATQGTDPATDTSSQDSAQPTFQETAQDNTSQPEAPQVNHSAEQSNSPEAETRLESPSKQETEKKDERSPSGSSIIGSDIDQTTERHNDRKVDPSHSSDSEDRNRG